MHQREQSQFCWGDAESLTFIQILITQISTLYTTICSAKQDGRMFIHFGWRMYLWAGFLFTYAVLATVFLSFQGWLSPLLNLGGTVANACLGVLLFNNIKAAKDEANQDKIPLIQV